MSFKKVRGENCELCDVLRIAQSLFLNIAHKCGGSTFGNDGFKTHDPESISIITTLFVTSNKHTMKPPLAVFQCFLQR